MVKAEVKGRTQYVKGVVRGSKGGTIASNGGADERPSPRKTEPPYRVNALRPKR